jgi:hypothetical protein
MGMEGHKTMKVRVPHPVLTTEEREKLLGALNRMKYDAQQNKRPSFVVVFWDFDRKEMAFSESFQMPRCSSG